MNACRVATRPTSKMKNAIAIGRVMTPSADRPRMTTRPPPMNRIRRWPARMFAKSRTLSEMIRTKCEIASMTKRTGFIPPGVPAGIQLAKYFFTPWALMPWMWYANHTTSVRTRGTEMLAVAA
jgi:hypothetical protein